MKLYRIFIPKCYNDGSCIEDKKLREITDKLIEQFGGYSANPNAEMPVFEGAWIDEKHNRSCMEKVYCVELFTEDTFDHQNWINSFTELTRQDLKQDDLFVIAQNAEVIKNYK